MTASLENLDSAAVHILRRLIAGQKVDAEPFSRIPMLQDSRDQVMRRGLVVERAKGKQLVFEITAAGLALQPAIAHRDAAIDQDRIARDHLAAAAERLRDAAPALLSALQDLIAALVEEDFASEDEAKLVAAWKRQDQAVAVARSAIHKAVTP